jgi:hypothetical protein
MRFVPVNAEDQFLSLASADTHLRQCSASVTNGGLRQSLSGCKKGNPAERKKSALILSLAQLRLGRIAHGCDLRDDGRAPTKNAISKARRPYGSSCIRGLWRYRWSKVCISLPPPASGLSAISTKLLFILCLTVVSRRLHSRPCEGGNECNRYVTTAKRGYDFRRRGQLGPNLSPQPTNGQNTKLQPMR